MTGGQAALVLTVALVVAAGCAAPTRNSNSGPDGLRRGANRLRLGCSLEPGKPGVCDGRWRAGRVSGQVDAPAGDATDWYRVKVADHDSCWRSNLHAVLTWQPRRGDPDVRLKLDGQEGHRSADRAGDHRRYLRQNLPPGTWYLKVDAIEGGAAAYHLLVYVTVINQCPMRPPPRRWRIGPPGQNR